MKIQLIDGVTSPFGEFECYSSHSQLDRRATALVISIDNRMQFPWLLSLRSFRKNNPWCKNVIVFFAVAGPTAALPTEPLGFVIDTDQHYPQLWPELSGMSVCAVACVHGDRFKYPALGPKTCVYSAPVMACAPRYLFLDLDTLTLESIENLANYTRDSSFFFYVPEYVHEHANNLYFHMFQPRGIYRGDTSDYREYGFDRYSMIDRLVCPIINTGLIATDNDNAWRVYHKLTEITRENPRVREWTTTPSSLGGFIGHREQAIYNLALLQARIEVTQGRSSENLQMMHVGENTLKVDTQGVIRRIANDVRVSVLHFNGYANPDGPSRKHYDNLVAKNAAVFKLLEA